MRILFSPMALTLTAVMTTLPLSFQLHLPSWPDPPQVVCLASQTSSAKTELLLSFLLFVFSPGLYCREANRYLPTCPQGNPVLPQSGVWHARLMVSLARVWILESDWFRVVLNCHNPHQVPVLTLASITRLIFPPESQKLWTLKK